MLSAYNIQILMGSFIFFADKIKGTKIDKLALTDYALQKLHQNLK